MKTKDELVVELKKLGIAVTKDGKVAKADIEKILAVKFVKAAVDDVRSQIAGLASGTLARLFKTNKYAEIEKMHEDWLDWWDIQIKGVHPAQHKGYTWQDAWQDYEATTKKQLKIAIDDPKSASANATAEENEEDFIDDDMTYDELKEHLGIQKYDSLGVLDVYMKKYQNSAKGPAALQKSLEDFKSDVEYAMPDVDKMLSAIESVLF